MNIQTDSSVTNNGGAASTFLNVGALTKSAGNGATTFGVNFVNQGRSNINLGGVYVHSGSITLSGGGKQQWHHDARPSDHR